MNSTEKALLSRTATREAHHEAAKGYDFDRSAWQRKQVRIWQVVASCAMLVAMVVSVAEFFRPQVKTEVPYVVRIDSSTGVVDSATRVVDGETTYEEVINNFFLRRYIQCRESYARFTYKMQYEECIRFTPDDARGPLLEIFDYEKPGSHFKRYGENGRVEITITYIKATAEKGKSEVHFIMNEVMDGATTRSTWVSTVKFKYDRSKVSSEETKKWNPLGFRVLDYRRDVEVVAK